MKEELYLRKIDDNYELFYKDLSDSSIPLHDEFPLLEAAVMIIYPDGGMDVIRVGKFPFHSYCYLELLKTSKRFAKLIRSLSIKFDFSCSFNTYDYDRKFLRTGISIIHNLKIKEYIENKESYYESPPFFLGMYPMKVSNEVNNNIQLIRDALGDDLGEGWYVEAIDDVLDERDLEKRGIKL